ncbi:hypothetical protein CR513_55444, partial [Mucuna pruriens]
MSVGILNGLDISVLGNSDGEHPVFHGGLHLVQLGIGGKRETLLELAGATLNVVTGLVVVLLLHLPLPTHLENPAIFHFYLHFLFLQPRHLCLQHVGLRCLLPVELAAHYRRLSGHCRAR